jgi:hypothetical protein
VLGLVMVMWRNGLGGGIAGGAVGECLTVVCILVRRSVCHISPNDS